MTRVGPEPVTREELTIVGLAVTTANAVEIDQNKARLPVLWRRFYQGAGRPTATTTVAHARRPGDDLQRSVGSLRTSSLHHSRH